MTSPDTIGELIGRLDHLVSLDKPESGGPYGGYAAAKCVEAMKDAALALERLQRERDDGWQDISTAPRDGTLCLFYSPGNPKAENFNACQPHYRVDCFQKDWPRPRHQLPEAPYTHWRALRSPGERQ